MEKKLIKSPIQKDDIAEDKLENSMEKLVEKSNTSDSEVFVSAFLKAIRGPEGPEGKEGKKGEDGKDYKLTEMDKRVIANLAYEVVADQVDNQIDESVKDIMAVIEGKLPDTVKKTFSDNKSMIEGMVGERFKKLAVEQNRGLESIKSSLLAQVTGESKKLVSEGQKMSQSMKDEIVKEYKDKLSKLVEESKTKDIYWQDIKKRPNIVTGLAHLVDVSVEAEPSNNQVLKYSSALKMWIPGTVSGGGGMTLIDVTGTIDDSNTTFSCDEPTYVVINGVWYKETGGAYTWSWAGGTLTLSGAIGTGSQIWAFV